jgi:histidine triad (HIT) family protein
VVPRAEVDHWIDLPATTNAHLIGVAHEIGVAQMEAFAPARIGLIIAGLEVPHTHLHVVPIDAERDLSFANADPDASAESLAAAGARLRSALTARGATGVSS